MKSTCNYQSVTAVILLYSVWSRSSLLATCSFVSDDGTKLVAWIEDTGRSWMSSLPSQASAALVNVSFARGAAPPKPVVPYDLELLQKSDDSKMVLHSWRDHRSPLSFKDNATQKASDVDVLDVSYYFHQEVLKMLSTRPMVQFCLVSVFFVIFIIFFECCHLQYSEVDFDAQFLPYRCIEAEQARGPGVLGTLEGAVRMWLIYLRPQALEATVFITMTGLLIWLGQYANTLLVNWSTDFWNKIEEWGTHRNATNDVNYFYALLLQFLFYAFISVFAGIYNSYLLSMFQIGVRSRITLRYASLWLTNSAYYRIELLQNLGYGLDNPDQRIQSDCDGFIGSSTGLVTSAANSAVQFCLFAHSIWVMSPPDAFGIAGLHIPGWLLWAAIIYCLINCIIVHHVGWSLKPLSATGDRVEADFRYELIAAREHAEQIALDRGENVHRGIVMGRFGMVRRCVWEYMFVNKRLGLVTSMLDQTSYVFIYACCGNSYVTGRMTLGSLMAVQQSFSLIKDAINWYPSSYPDIMDWFATTKRLLALEAYISKFAEASFYSGASVQEAPGVGLSMEDLSVWVPTEKGDLFPEESHDDGDGGTVRVPSNGSTNAYHFKTRVLLDSLSIDFRKGSRIIMEGPSGIGKSSLIRTLSGAWPFADGKVTIPGKRQSMFFSANICLPRAPLRAVVAYPRFPHEFKDTDITGVLTLVHLEHLFMCRSLDDVQDWNNILSHGEKARISLARLALHRPSLAVLDEPVAHLPNLMQRTLLRDVLGSLPADATVLIVNHAVNNDILSLFTSRYEFDVNRMTLKPVHRGDV